MTIVKEISNVSPVPGQVVSVSRSNNRTGMVFDVSVRLCWKITAAGVKFTYYTDMVQVEVNRATDTVASFKARLKALYDQKVLADTTEADMIYALMNLSLP
jgi:hypothetical protein